MNNEELLNLWQENQQSADAHDHGDLVNKIQSKSKNKMETTFEKVRTRTKNLSLIIFVLLLGTACITDYNNTMEVLYLGLLFIGLVSYLVISAKILLNDYTSTDVVSSLKVKVEMIQSYVRNYSVFSSFFYVGIVLLILLQVITVLPIEIDLMIEAAVFMLGVWIFFMYKSSVNEEDSFAMQTELKELKQMLTSLTNPR